MKPQEGRWGRERAVATEVSLKDARCEDCSEFAGKRGDPGRRNSIGKGKEWSNSAVLGFLEGQMEARAMGG